MKVYPESPKTDRPVLGDKSVAVSSLRCVIITTWIDLASFRGLSWKGQECLAGQETQVREELSPDGQRWIAQDWYQREKARSCYVAEIKTVRHHDDHTNYIVHSPDICVSSSFWLLDRWGWLEWKQWNLLHHWTSYTGYIYGGNRFASDCFYLSLPERLLEHLRFHYHSVKYCFCTARHVNNQWHP